MQHAPNFHCSDMPGFFSKHSDQLGMMCVVLFFLCYALHTVLAAHVASEVAPNTWTVRQALDDINRTLNEDFDHHLYHTAMLELSSSFREGQQGFTGHLMSPTRPHCDLRRGIQEAILAAHEGKVSYPGGSSMMDGDLSHTMASMAATAQGPGAAESILPVQLGKRMFLHRDGVFLVSPWVQASKLYRWGLVLFKPLSRLWWQSSHH